MSKCYSVDIYEDGAFRLWTYSQLENKKYSGTFYVESDELFFELNKGSCSPLSEEEKLKIESEEFIKCHFTFLSQDYEYLKVIKNIE